MENLTPEHRYYLAMCGLFNDSDRDVLEHWPKYEAVFTSLIAKDTIGDQHLMQTFIQFFVNRYPSQKSKAIELCTKTKPLFTKSWFKEFGESKLKLDNNCILKDTKAENEFRKVIAAFLKTEGADMSLVSKVEETQKEDGEEAGLSKAALKRRRKKEAARKAAEEAGEEPKTSARGEEEKVKQPKSARAQEKKEEQPKAPVQ